MPMTETMSAAISQQKAAMAQSKPREGRGTYGTERAVSRADWRRCSQESTA